MFDRGLQPERTELAWRRTALSVGVGSVVALRILPTLLGDVRWVVPGALRILFAGWLRITARARARRATDALVRRATETALPGGRTLPALAAPSALACWRWWSHSVPERRRRAASTTTPPTQAACEGIQ